MDGWMDGGNIYNNNDNNDNNSYKFDYSNLYKLYSVTIMKAV